MSTSVEDDEFDTHADIVYETAQEYTVGRCHRDIILLQKENSF